MAEIRQYSGQFRPETDRQHPATVVGFRRRQNSGNQMLPDSEAGWIPTTDNCLNSDNQILNVRARTQSLILENDLRF
jgi:hypothetical protein